MVKFATSWIVHGPSFLPLEAAGLQSPDASASLLALCHCGAQQAAHLMACGHVACPGHETCNCEGKEVAVSLDFQKCKDCLRVAKLVWTCFELTSALLYVCYRYIPYFLLHPSWSVGINGILLNIKQTSSSQRIPRSLQRLTPWCARFKRSCRKIPKSNAWFSPSGLQLYENWKKLYDCRALSPWYQLQGENVARRPWSPWFCWRRISFARKSFQETDRSMGPWMSTQWLAMSFWPTGSSLQWRLTYWSNESSNLPRWINLELLLQLSFIASWWVIPWPGCVT